MLTDFQKTLLRGHIMALSPSGDNRLGDYGIPKGVLKLLGYIDYKGNWTGKAGLRTGQDFLFSLHAQGEILNEWLDYLDSEIRAQGLYDYIGQKVYGEEVTIEGLVQAAYILGVDTVRDIMQGKEDSGIIEDIATSSGGWLDSLYHGDTRGE